MSKEESFTIVVPYKGEDKTLEGKLRISAYSYQFIFIIDEVEFVVEKDNEGNFRAFAPVSLSRKAGKIDPLLIQAIIQEMEKLF